MIYILSVSRDITISLGIAMGTSKCVLSMFFPTKKIFPLFPPNHRIISIPSNKNLSF